MVDGQPARTRAKDSDRTVTCQILDTALAEGQLSMAEHGERIKSATKAATLGDLRALVADLQSSDTPVQLPAPKPGPLPRSGTSWGIRLATASVLVLLGIGIGWGLYGNTGSPFSHTPDPGARPDGIGPVVLAPPRQLHSLGGLNGLFEQMRSKFGDTLGYGLVIYPDYAVLRRPDPSDARRTLSYSYRGGWDDPSTSPSNPGARIIDLAKFDTAAVVGVLRGAPETMDIKPGDVKSAYLSIDPAGDDTAAEPLQIAVYVSSDVGSGYIALNPDGTVKRISYP